MVTKNVEVSELGEQKMYPSEEVLTNLLGSVYGVWKELETELAQDEFALTFFWTYNQKSKFWMCTVSREKKSLIWITLWEGFFKVQLYFTEKQLDNTVELDISEQGKEYLRSSKLVGKLYPVFIEIDRQEKLADLLKIVKMKLRQS